MRLFVHNPHNFNLIGTPVSYWLIGKKPMPKYWYLLDRENIVEHDLYFFIDATTSSLLPDQYFGKLPFLVRYLITWIESHLWCTLNDVPNRRLKFRSAESRSNDALLSFVYRDFRGRFSARRNIISEFRTVFAHLSHYCIDLGSISENTRNLKDKIWFIAEAPLHENCPIFRTGFDWYDRPVLVLPFSPQPRFKSKKPTAQRQNRAVSTGSFHILSEEPDQHLWETFKTLSGLDTVHPLRQALEGQKSEVRNEIEVMNARFWETKPEQAKAKAGLFNRLVRALRRVRATASPQSRYLSVDIVDLYNDYAMSLIGEEATGLPGVGMAESMACGCVYIGRRDPMYAALGMTEGTHYLAYDGTVDDLRKVIEVARTDLSKLKAISAAALDIAEREWSKTSVTARLVALAKDACRS